ncbi:MAG: restriction endonuclease [Pseudomonadota bacterium]
MKWQEYQEAVAVLYEQLEGFGNVLRNVCLPDLVTGQRRQIDVMIDLKERGHSLRMLVDAKFHSTPLDVKDVEEVAALSQSVGANKTIIVAANGFTSPAMTKAKFIQCDLRLLTVEEALDLIVPDKWKMCPICNADCIVLDQEGMTQLQNGLIFWWLAGQCRECKSARVHCQDCGMKMYIETGKSVVCGCGHGWHITHDGVAIEFLKEEPQW